ncbi:MAG: polysaccharide pyruvyl transferase family protein [Burkholderiaceae bacterium]
MSQVPDTIQEKSAIRQTLFIGEYASRNVGDGIIKLAIEKLCAAHGVPATFRDFYGSVPPSAEPSVSTDRTASNPGQTAPASSKPGTPSLPQRLWRALLRVDLVNYAIALLFYCTRYRRIANGYQVARHRQVVIGGGNLLMDNYLNFPLLILRIVQQCERRGVPVKLFSVGAGKGYSRLGRRIMARILRSDAVTCVVCRDGNTYELIKAIAGEAARHKILCGVDTGLYLNRQDNPSEPGDVIGLGVIAPSVLRAVTPEHPMADPRYALQWWDDLIAALAREVGAERIELISNGSGADNEFAHAVWQALSPKYPGLSVCTSIESPDDLLRRIGGYRALAAYRMHATVTAMVLDVPVIGFEWDPKVLQLFTYCGKRDACIALAEFMQRPVRDIIAAMLRQTPAQLTPVRLALDRDFRHAILA